MTAEKSKHSHDLPAAPVPRNQFPFQMAAQSIIYLHNICVARQVPFPPAWHLLWRATRCSNRDFIELNRLTYEMQHAKAGNISFGMYQAHILKNLGYVLTLSSPHSTQGSYSFWSVLSRQHLHKKLSSSPTSLNLSIFRNGSPSWLSASLLLLRTS